MKRSPAFPKKPGFCAAIVFENMGAGVSIRPPRGIGSVGENGKVN